MRREEREQREGKEGVKAWMISSSLLRPSVCAEETRPEGEKERGFHKDVFLGKGTYGAVWRVTKKDTGKIYAMKTVDMRNKKQSEKCVVVSRGWCCVCAFSRVLAANDREDAVNEIRILASVRHPNIIRFRESFIENDTLFIVCPPMCQSCDLCFPSCEFLLSGFCVPEQITDFANKTDVSVVISQHKKRGTFLSENTIWSIFIQVVLGLQYLHRHSILHRVSYIPPTHARICSDLIVFCMYPPNTQDLKSSNVFLTDTPVVAKIGDLGVAKVLKSAFTQTVIGTPFYISPEIWRKQPYNSKSDMWSLGCVLYEMCMLRHPFNASSPKELSQKILRCSYPPVIGYSDDMKNMVNNLLCVEAATRPSAPDVLADPLIKCRMNLIPKACVPTAAELAPARTAPPAASLTAGTFGSASARPASGGNSSHSGASSSSSSSSSTAGAVGESVSPPRPPEASTRTAAATEQILRTIAVPRNLSRIHLPPPAYVTPVSEQRTLSFLDEVQTGPGGMSVSKLCLDDEDADVPPRPVEHSTVEEVLPKEPQQPQQQHVQVLPTVPAVPAVAVAAAVPQTVVPSAAAEKSAPVVPVPVPVAIPTPVPRPAAPVEPPVAVPVAVPETQPLGQPPAKRHFKFDSQPFKDPPVAVAAEPAPPPERRAAVRRSIVPRPSVPDDAPADRHPAQRFVFRRPSVVPPVHAEGAGSAGTVSSRAHEPPSRAEVPHVPPPHAPLPPPPPAVAVPESLPVCAEPAPPQSAAPGSAPEAADAFAAPVGVPAHAPISDRDRHNMMVQKFLRQRRHSVFFRPPQLLAAALEAAPPAPAEPPPPTATAAPPARRPSIAVAAPAPPRTEAPAPRHSVAVRRPSVVPLLARGAAASARGSAGATAGTARSPGRRAHAAGAGSSSSSSSAFAEPLPVAFGTRHARESVAPRRPAGAPGHGAGGASGAPARRASVVPGAGASHRSSVSSSSSGRRASVVPGARKSTLPVWR